MSFFKKIAEIFSTPNRPMDPSYWVAVKCKRCGEILRVRINLYNDLSIDYGEDGGATSYFCRKLVVGESRCFQQIEIKLTFDSNRKLIDRQVTGGQFVDE